MTALGMDPAPRPFLKWAGGKRQLLPTIDKHLPEGLHDGTITRYVEPFVGGGAVFFHLRQRYPLQDFHISDFNPDLVNAYAVIRDELDALLDALQVIADEYLPLEHEKRSEVYYRIRDEYNASREDPPSATDRAAQTIFLNRTCFNGLYRVHSKGEYNVPHGRYKNPPIRDAENLRSVGMALQGVTISCGSYEICEANVDDATFVYMDPPYRPLPNTPSFTDYAEKSSFGDEDQHTLGAFFSEMSGRGASLMLSNSDPHVTDEKDDFFDDLYSDFSIHRVEAIRAINSDGAGRGAITEILVTNYEVSG